MLIYNLSDDREKKALCYHESQDKSLSAHQRWNLPFDSVERMVEWLRHWT